MTTLRNSRLNRRIDQFVERLIAGDNQITAWKAISPNHRKMTREQQDSAAYKFSCRPEVKDRYRSVLASTPLDKILTGPEHMRTLIERAKTAFDAKNYTASAAYDRILASPTGLINDKLTVNWGHDDAELVRRLVGDDPVKQALARQLLGSNSFEPAQPLSQPEQINTPTSDTKH